ncbi:MAG TPA: alpha/beta hydrolase [Caulobacteraceae bacterium]|nr:alpha/beta hydrolase [Caulobacteraceae bacterium]
MTDPVLEHLAKSARHTTFYLSCGARGATPIIFVHGWPELAISWRHQLPVFAGLGFRAVAPDMRGYGRSGVYPRHEDYAQEEIVADMIELIDALGVEKAVWVGHDWGAPVVWAIAQHHPSRCHGVANLCVPYIPEGFAPETIIPLADRSVYPEARSRRRSGTISYSTRRISPPPKRASEAMSAPRSRRCFERATRPAGASRRSPPSSAPTGVGSAPRCRRPICRATAPC